MKYDEFIGHVQDRARLGTQGDAVRAVRATLETLAERVVADEAQHVAAQLPEEVGYYLRQQAETTERFSLGEFFERVAKRENEDVPAATHHARAVISVLTEAVTASELNDLKAQLPDEFQPLFTAGREGEMRTT